MRFWPLNRRGQINEEDLPSLQDEEETVEWREHAGIAWLLAFTTLMATVFIAFGLFFGGRWAYRKVAGTNDKKTGTQQVTSADQTQQPAQTSTSDNKTPSTTPAASTPSAATQPVTQPVAQPATQNLVNTGPGNTIAIFLATTIVAALLHASYTRRKPISN